MNATTQQTLYVIKKFEDMSTASQAVAQDMNISVTEVHTLYREFLRYWKSQSEETQNFFVTGTKKILQFAKCHAAFEIICLELIDHEIVIWPIEHFENLHISDISLTEYPSDAGIETSRGGKSIAKFLDNAVWAQGQYSATKCFAEAMTAFH